MSVLDFRFMPVKRSGRNVHASERHTVVLQIRCRPELAERAREVAKVRGVELSRILEEWLVANSDPDPP